MGLFSQLQKAQSIASGTYTLGANILSPHASDSLLPVLLPDVDNSAFPVSMQEAMAVPAVSRGIQLVSSIGSGFPLLSEGIEQPWLAKTKGAVTPQLRLAQTIQDLIFYRHSLWAVERANGVVTGAIRVDPARWALDAQGFVTVDGDPNTNQDELLYIPSLLPIGFLEAARDSVRHYTALARIIANRSEVPEPVITVKETSDFSGTPEEIDTAIDHLETTLANRKGGIVYVPYGVDIDGFGGSDSANTMMIGARMAVRTDLANHLGINSALLDGSTGSNEVYSNALQSKNELLEMSLKTWTQPIADRLSQDDVTPEGTKVKFDYSTFDSANDAAGNTGTATENK